MKIQIRNVSEETHRAAKILAAHTGVSLNKFYLDAIHHECLRVAHQRGLTETVIRATDPSAALKTDKPASGKARKPARS